MMCQPQVEWNWTPEYYQGSFDQMKAHSARGALSTFPDFTQEFEIYMDANINCTNFELL
jgi:hypothetical protein